MNKNRRIKGNKHIKYLGKQRKCCLNQSWSKMKFIIIAMKQRYQSRSEQYKKRIQSTNITDQQKGRSHSKQQIGGLKKCGKRAYKLQDGTDDDSEEVWIMCVQLQDGTDNESEEVWTMCVQTARWNRQ